MSGFVIDLGTLPGGLNRLTVECDPRELDLPAPEWSGPVRGDLAVEKAGEKVAVRGRLLAVAHLDCARCLKDFDLSVEAPIAVYAERTGTAGRLEAELERDDYMLFHDGRRLDLRAQARECLLLEVPMTPRCREDCRGLCPRCGADLNQGPCGCTG